MADSVTANLLHATQKALWSVRQVHPERIREHARHEREKAGSEVPLELFLLGPSHFVQDDRSHEGIAALGLEEPKSADLGAIGRPEENQIGERRVNRPFDPQSVGMGRSGEVTQNRGSIP